MRDSLSMQCVQSDAIANWAHTAHTEWLLSCPAMLVQQVLWYMTMSRDVYPFCKTW